MRYKIEWQAGGDLEINTEGTSWSPDELVAQVEEAIGEALDGVLERVKEEFDDCDVSGDEAAFECKPRRIT